VAGFLQRKKMLSMIAGVGCLARRTLPAFSFRVVLTVDIQLAAASRDTTVALLAPFGRMRTALLGFLGVLPVLVTCARPAYALCVLVLLGHELPSY
jgi:hypothetical protein